MGSPAPIPVGPCARLRHGAGGIALALVVSLVLLGAPSAAVAKRVPTDQIAGLSLASVDPSLTVAPDITAITGVLVDATGRQLWSRQPTMRRAMASTTKMMTALVVLERSSVDEMVTISSAASNVPYATGLLAGERVSVRQLLELALVASSNDAVTALAQHVGGNEGAFVTIMNDRARELELNETHFVNPHGLDRPGHYSTAEDLASLSRTAMLLPEFRRIVMLRSVTLPAYKERPARLLKSTDELLGSYPGILGIKTGFTDDAKYSFIASAERDGVTLTAVILGAPRSSTRFKHAARLLDWGFGHLSMQSLADPTEALGTVPIQQNSVRSVPVRLSEETSVPVFDLDGPVARSAFFKTQVSLPLYEGQPLGEMEFKQGERLLVRAQVVAARAVASAEETVGAVPVSDYLSKTVTARTADSSASVAVFDPANPVERSVKLDPSVSAPVREGDPLGQIIYSQHGRVIATVSVVATTDIAAPGTLARVGIWIARGWRVLIGRPKMASLQVIES